MICLLAFLGMSLYGRDKLPKIRVADDGRSFVTDDGQPFVPFGVNYFRPGTGWAPKFWTLFDEEAFRADFALMKETGVNCIRIFLTYGSFQTETGALHPEGLAKFDKLLELAEEFGIYIHPCGISPFGEPACEEHAKQWNQRFTNDEAIAARVQFLKAFAARYKGHSAIFAYDLKNEPSIPWDEEPSIKPKWNLWLKKHFLSAEDFAKKRNIPLETVKWGDEDAPKDFTNRALILDYQHFREELADHWTRIQAEAIKSVDPDALVTVGYIQWSVPALLPGLQHYAAFKPARQAPYVDFMEIHFYPLAVGFFEYENKSDLEQNLAYLEAIVSEVAATGKPVVIAEFGWYGGGQLKNCCPDNPAWTEAQQAHWNSLLIETTKGLAVGWLNWSFFDMPESTDVTELTGLYTADGKPKAWATTFKKLSKELSGQAIPPKIIGSRPTLNWDQTISDPQAAKDFLQAYYEAFLKEKQLP